MLLTFTAQKMKFFARNFFSKCGQIRRKLTDILQVFCKKGILRIFRKIHRKNTCARASFSIKLQALQNTSRRLLLKHSLLVSPIKSVKDLPKLEIWQVPDSVSNICSNRGKRTFAVIINDYKIVYGNLEISKWVIFSNVFLHEKTGHKSDKKWNISKTKQYKRELQVAKNWPGDEYFKHGKSKFWERPFFSKGKYFNVEVNI